MMKLLNQLNPTLSIAVISALVSLMLSLGSVPNPDGVLYLHTAEQFIQGGLPAAMASYSWPFYSILLACIHLISPLTLIVSAHVINALLLAGVAGILIKITEQLGGSSKLQWLAGLLILLHPSLNDYRHYIIRDFGLWFFSLLSVWAMIAFYQQAKIRYPIIWAISLSIAFLFRPEAAVLLVATPLALLLSPATRHYKILSLFYGLILLGMVLIFAINPSLTWLHHSRFAHEVSSPLLSLYHGFMSKGQALASFMAPELQAKDGYFALAVFIIFFTLYKIIKAFNLIYLLLLIIGVRVLRSQSALKIILGYLTLTVCLLFFFMLHSYFLSSRYTMLTVLLLLPMVPFGAQHLFEKIKANHWNPIIKKILAVLAIVYAIIQAIHLLQATGAHQQLRQAGEWVDSHIPKNAKIYINHRTIAYYAHHPTTQWQSDFYPIKSFAERQQQNTYHYIVWRFTDNNQAQAALARAGKQPIKTFSTKSDTIIVFKMRNQA